LDSAVQAVRLGADDYLTKPFSLGQIEVIVQRVSDRQALEAENRHLAWKAGNRKGGASGDVATDHLDAIDARLAKIESISGGSSPIGRASDPPLTRLPTAPPAVPDNTDLASSQRRLRALVRTEAKARC
jgi:CheY-like chemotaxis protein